MISHICSVFPDIRTAPAEAECIIFGVQLSNALFHSGGKKGESSSNEIMDFPYYVNECVLEKMAFNKQEYKKVIPDPLSPAPLIIRTFFYPG